ncbi:MAG: 3-hydroxyacyl-CoA dehydrogenase NAD-binding domain-containing protein [Burkholderiales bacterium]|jgi:3-hydroxybutyryl-CoA dehydrogenase
MATTLKNLAVVGAGTMGADMAVRFAVAGLNVYLMARPGKSRDSFAQRAQRSAADLGADYSKLKIELVPTLEQLPWAELDLVIENVKEDLAVKQEVFGETVALAKPQTPLTSNSSTYSVRRIAEGLDTQERMFGLHFFMPAHLIPLVEVVLTPHTDPALVQRIYDEMEALALKPVMVKQDVPGFLANRMQAALGREAWSLIDRGIATPEDVDRAVRYGFGFRYTAAGPILQKEISGLDVTAAAAASLYPDLCNDDGPPKFLTDMVERGERGMKTGKGFWEWDDEKIEAERARYARALKAALAILQSEQT